MHSLFRLLCCISVVAFSMSANAQLSSRMGGLAVYDADRDITWLADANFAQTSGFSASGAMNLFVANQFIAQLNLDSFAGVSDWALPSADIACGLNPNCNDSDMGHLFYDELGGTAGMSILSSGSPNLALFSNIQSARYWTGTHAGGQFVFDFAGGSQATSPTALNNRVWAVRSGDVGNGSQPVPALPWWGVIALTALVSAAGAYMLSGRGTQSAG